MAYTIADLCAPHCGHSFCYKIKTLLAQKRPATAIVSLLLSSFLGLTPEAFHHSSPNKAYVLDARFRDVRRPTAIILNSLKVKGEIIAVPFGFHLYPAAANQPLVGDPFPCVLKRIDEFMQETFGVNEPTFPAGSFDATRLVLADDHNSVIIPCFWAGITKGDWLYERSKLKIDSQAFTKAFGFRRPKASRIVALDKIPEQWLYAKECVKLAKALFPVNHNTALTFASKA